MMVAVVLIARAVFTSVLRGIARASANSFSGPPPHAPRPNSSPASSPGGDLRKDPVCGTYVAESSALKRHADGQTFYYCSESCREKHVLAAR